jgi:manganese efflux pump family protein
VRWTTVAAAAASLLAVLLLTACAATAAQPTATPAATTPASSQACYNFAVSALRNRVVVRQRPAACAGLSQAVVNQEVDRAIRTVVGPHPKALERQLAAAYSRYLAALIKPVKAPPPASVAAGPATTSSQLAIRLTALIAWLAAAAAGAYLLSAWLIRDGRRRAINKPGVPSAVPVAHAGLAIAGLCIWIAFMVTSTSALAWAAVGLTWVIAGLGMATLLAASPEQSVSGNTEAAELAEAARTSTAPFPTRAPVIIIALHGAFATATILFVLLAAVGIG